MTTAIDTNILVALWDAGEGLHEIARQGLEAASRKGRLTISCVVYAELLAAPGRKEDFLDRFCEETGIGVEWSLGEEVWRTAGRARQGYAMRRSRQKGAGPRRLLADFVVGAHALVHGYRLMTLDERLFRAAFPRLEIVAV